MSSATAPSAPLPGPEAQDVRGRLLLAAAALFNRRGYAATSVGEIVAAAGVTKPTLYYYFKSKEGIYLEMMREGAERYRDIVERHREADGVPAAERIRGLCDEVFALVLRNLPVVRVMYSTYYGPAQGAPHVDFDSFHEAFRDALRHLVVLGVRRREFGRHDPDQAVLAISGVLSAAIESHLCHPERAVDRAALSAALSIVFRGLAAKPAPVRRER